MVGEGPVEVRDPCLSSFKCAIHFLIVWFANGDLAECTEKTDVYAHQLWYIGELLALGQTRHGDCFEDAMCLYQQNPRPCVIMLHPEILDLSRWLYCRWPWWACHKERTECLAWCASWDCLAGKSMRRARDSHKVYSNSTPSWLDCKRYQDKFRLDLHGPYLPYHTKQMILESLSGSGAKSMLIIHFIEWKCSYLLKM